VICLDVPRGTRELSEEFWSGALGRTFVRGQTHPEYSHFGMVNAHVLLLQGMGEGDARVHLDIHTDDLSSEVARLVALGAREQARHDNWVVMADPSGLTFCVVPVASDDETLEGATRWP